MYYDPKTGKEVVLKGTLGEQNLAANKMGLDYKPTTTVGTAIAPVTTPLASPYSPLATSSAGTGTAISTSAPTVAGETATTADISKLWAEDPIAKKAHVDTQAEIQARIDALEVRRANEVAALQAQFDQKKQQTGEAQTKEKGTMTSTLSRIGGYLGDSASATGALVNLNQTHQYQLNDLESKRASAIQEARSAIDDKQFDLARLKANEAKDYAKEIETSKQNFFNNAMKITQEARASDEYTRKAIKDKLDNLAYLSPDKISPETKSEIDTFYGTPGFTDNYLTVTNQAAQAKTTKDVMDARKATLDFLQNIPAGQEITMPDGTVFTGMGKAGDVSTFMLKDKSGNNILVTYNKMTGETGYSNTGVVGSTTGNGTSASSVDPVVKDNATAMIQTKLENSKDPKTGEYDPDVYLAERNKIKEGDFPQLVSYFDKLFLDKNNGFFTDDAIRRLRSKGVFFGDTSLPDPTSTNLDGDTAAVIGQ